MDAFQNIGIKDFFKRYGYKYGIQRGIFTAFPLHIVRDYENKKILYYRKIEKTLKHKYSKAATKNPEGLRFGKINCNNPIWIYWKQGIENAPDVVKACIHSIKDNTETEIILLTEENTSDYVKFPGYILEKLSNGNMSAAAFSDLLRFTLLEHYGGTWIDATVYLTDRLPAYITDSDLFAFQDSFGLIRNPALMSVWLLHSTAGNQIIRETRNIAYEYWKHQEHVIEYLLPYIIFTMVLENHPEEFSKMPYANSDYCHLMLNEIGNPYDEMKYTHITALSSVHKLSYKLQERVYADKDNLYHRLVAHTVDTIGGGIA